jgi:hypothetical protein
MLGAWSRLRDQPLSRYKSGEGQPLSSYKSGKGQPLSSYKSGKGGDESPAYHALLHALKAQALSSSIEAWSCGGKSSGVQCTHPHHVYTRRAHPHGVSSAGVAQRVQRVWRGQYGRCNIRTTLHVSSTRVVMFPVGHPARAHGRARVCMTAGHPVGRVQSGHRTGVTTARPSRYTRRGVYKGLHTSTLVRP